MDHLPADVALEVARRLKEACKGAGAARLAAFAAHRTAAEGWFRGELLGIAAAIVGEGQALAFRPDLRLTGTTRSRVDLCVTTLRQHQVLMDIAHWPIRAEAAKVPLGAKAARAAAKTQSAGSAPTVATMFKKATPGTPRGLVRRLPAEPGEDVFLLLVMTPRPSPRAWTAALDAFRNDSEIKTRATIRSLGRIEDFPPEFAIGVLRVSGK